MSYEFYKVLHIIGLACLLLGFGLGLSYFLLAKGGKGGGNRALKIWTFALHGVGLAIMFVAGFGLLAKMGLMGGMPDWVYGKLVVWLALAAAITLVKRRPQWFPALAVVIVGLVGYAAKLAITKTL